MTVDMVTLLRELDISIVAGSAAGTWVLRAPDGLRVTVTPTSAAERLSSRMLRNSRTHRDGDVPLLLVGRTATAAVLERAEAGDVAVLTAEPIRFTHAGIVCEVPMRQRHPPQGRTPGRPAWIRWAVERYLLLAEHPATQGKIAEVLGTSQQSVSQAVKHFGSLIADHGDGLRVTQPRKLLERWLEEYAGPGGQEFGWYSLAPIGDQTAAAVRVSADVELEPLVSGDLAADVIAPWKLPARGRIYVRDPVDLSGDGFVPAPLEDASLVTCVPRDPTLWRLTHLHDPRLASDVLPLADPLVVLWDLHASQDVDSDQAAEKIADFVVGPTP